MSELRLIYFADPMCSSCLSPLFRRNCVR
jgi:protein-disulfide isomerase-like protein with CxxC motif